MSDLFGPIDEIIFIHVHLHKVHLAGDIELVSFLQSFFLCFWSIRRGTFGGRCRLGSSPLTTMKAFLVDVFGTSSLFMSFLFFGGITFAVTTYDTGGQTTITSLTQSTVDTRAGIHRRVIIAISLLADTVCSFAGTFGGNTLGGKR